MGVSSAAVRRGRHVLRPARPTTGQVGLAGQAAAKAGARLAP
ncbi:hypothetical protein [Streptomyces sp. 8N706]